MFIIFCCLKVKPQSLFKINSLLINIIGLLIMSTSYLTFFLLQKSYRKKRNTGYTIYLQFFVVDVLYSLSATAIANFMYYKFHKTNSITDKTHERWTRYYLNITLIYILYSFSMSMVFIALLPVRSIIILLLCVSVYFSVLHRQYLSENLDKSSMPYISDEDKERERNSI